MNATATTTTDDLLEVIMDAGFCPMEAADTLVAEYEFTARQASVLSYFSAFDAFRVESTVGSDWVSLVRWSEDGIDLLVIDRNGVECGDITFPMSPRGLDWFTKVIG